jgi:hypothetical protein
MLILIYFQKQREESKSRFTLKLLQTECLVQEWVRVEITLGTMIGPPNPNRVFNLQTAELIVINELAQELYWDLEVMSGIAKEMSTDTQLSNDALYTANLVVNNIIGISPEFTSSW